MEKVLRASTAGFPCERHLWYSLNVASGGQGDERTQRIFDVGACLEPLVVEWLRQDGWTVEYNAGSQEAPLEVKIELGDGTLAGHPDCFISRGDLQNVLVDIKTMNERSFRMWRREGSMKSKPQYVDQLHIYARGCLEMGRKIERLGIVGVNKNNSEMHIDFFEYDESRVAEILERAERVLKCEAAPETDSPRESWCCGYCEYAEQCGTVRIDREPVTKEAAEVTEDEALIGALHDLKLSREMCKESRELEARAKARLDGYMHASGKREVQGGGLMFQLLERATSRFDTTQFKKDHPELVSTYMKASVSKVYEVKEL